MRMAPSSGSDLNVSQLVDSSGRIKGSDLVGEGVSLRDLKGSSQAQSLCPACGSDVKSQLLL
jgi:fumarylacetoacetate (FAA) hydrolase family protein